MIRIVVISLVASLAGCSMYPTAESRIAAYKERCSMIGYSQGSDENAACVLELEKSYQEGKAGSTSSSNGGLSFMCRNAISSGDQGAINVHCN